MLNKMIDTVHEIPVPYSKSQRLQQRPLRQRSPEGKQKTRQYKRDFTLVFQY